MSELSKLDSHTNRDIIITLIQADLKHNQLLGNLRKAELHTDEYALPLHKAVAQLMGLGEETHNQWSDIYDGFLINAHLHPVSNNSDSLLSMAEECYDILCASITVENHLKSKG